MTDSTPKRAKTDSGLLERPASPSDVGPIILPDAPSGNQFGTFGGVFTPSILTILGVIMFMRAGYVTGQAGIGAALLILLIAKFITFLTGLSISGISTNTRVKGGGAYFLISRSLGPEFGGSIGLALFLAQALSVPFYIIGFVEAMTLVFPSVAPWGLYISLGTAVVLFVVNYVGASWAIKAQYFILAVLVLSVVALLGGAIVQFDTATFQANWDPAYTSPDIDFWVIFAIFFPAVTGIMAGVNMSGDLANPSRSIPRGTLWAVVVGGVVYGAQVLLTGGAQTRTQLVDGPYETLLEQALFGFDFLIAGGVFAATLSSALGSLLGAPRILQALARDQIFGILRPFGQGVGEGDEPRRGLWVTLVMTVATLLIADMAGGNALNSVAVVLTMFFLFTYGMTNMAAFIEKFGQNPSFRPRFKYFHWSTALLGALGCVGAAVLINPIAAFVAALVIVLVFVDVRRRVLESSFGDSRRGFFYGRTRANLMRLAQHPQHAKNWRPTTLVLSGNPAHRGTLTHYALLLGSNRGIVTLSSIIVGNPFELVEKRRDAIAALETWIAHRSLDAFAECIVAADVNTGIASLCQAHSIGPLKPNLVVLGWSESEERAGRFALILDHISRLDMSQVVVVDHGLPEPSELNPNRRIDLWWRGRRNGSLMVILAYLITLNDGWRSAAIRICRMVRDGDAKTSALEEITALADTARIDVEPHVVQAQSIRETLLEHSADASVVMLGFDPPGDHETAVQFHRRLSALTESLPTTLLVGSSGDADVFA